MLSVSSVGQSHGLYELHDECADVAEIIAGSLSEAEGKDDSTLRWLDRWDELDSTQGVQDEHKKSRLFFRDLAGISKLELEPATALACFEEQLRIIGFAHRCNLMRQLDDNAGSNVRAEVIEKLIKDNVYDCSATKQRVILAMQPHGIAVLREHYSKSLPDSLLHKMLKMAEKLSVSQQESLSLYEEVVLKIVGVKHEDSQPACLAEYFYNMAEEIEAHAELGAECYSFVNGNARAVSSAAVAAVAEKVVRGSRRSTFSRFIGEIASSSFSGAKSIFNAVYSSAKKVTSLVGELLPTSMLSAPGDSEIVNQGSSHAILHDHKRQNLDMVQPSFMRSMAMMELDIIARLLQSNISLQIDENVHLCAGNYRDGIELRWDGSNIISLSTSATSKSS